MTEEIVYCPSCSHRLRVPEELLGEIVQCPLCRLVFTTPTRGGSAPRRLPPFAGAAVSSSAPPAPLPASGPSEPSPAAASPDQAIAPPAPLSAPLDLRQQALADLRPPAIALLVTGLLGLAADLLSLWAWMRLPEEALERFPLGLTPPPPGAMIAALAIFTLLSAVVALGAMQMLSLRWYPLALAGSLLAMINLANACCLLGVPFGIWALVVLLRPDVREAFRNS